MVRRSFRIGLRLGLLAGVIVALAKVVQSRRSGREEFSPPPGVTWPPLQGDPITVEPPAATAVTERMAPVRTAPVEPPPPPAPAWAPAPDAAWAPAPASPPVENQPAPVRFDTTTPSATGDVPPMAPARASDEPYDPWTPPTGATPEPEEVADEPESAPGEASPAAPVTASLPAEKVAEVVKKAARQPVKKGAARKVAARKVAPFTAAPAAPTPVRSRVRKARRQPWVEPVGTDTPTSHPVKAKLSSMLYHLPGMAFYNRTRPDRCYVDAEAAEADGFIRAKR